MGIYKVVGGPINFYNAPVALSDRDARRFGDKLIPHEVVVSFDGEIPAEKAIKPGWYDLADPPLVLKSGMEVGLMESGFLAYKDNLEPMED